MSEQNQSEQNLFVNGDYVKTVQTKYGELININFKLEEFSAFVKEHKKDGWLNCTLKESKEGKPYLVLNTYKQKSPEYDMDDSNIPF